MRTPRTIRGHTWPPPITNLHEPAGDNTADARGLRGLRLPHVAQALARRASRARHALRPSRRTARVGPEERLPAGADDQARLEAGRHAHGHLPGLPRPARA